MRFPNAFSGVKKIWLAEILMLLAAVLSIVIIVIAATGATLSEVDGSETIIITDGLLAVIGGVGIAAALVMLVAFVLNMVGLINARKDEDSFSKALLFTCLGIVAGVVSAIWSDNTRLVKSMETCTSLCNLFASYYVLTGIANLADQMPDPETKSIVLKSRTLLEFTFCATAIFKLIIVLFYVQTGSTFYTILGLIALVLEMVSYVLYLRALSKGKSMLAR